MLPSVIETERLRLEQLGRDNLDVLEYYEVCSSDPGIDEVTEYLSWQPHENPKETADNLEEAEELWQNREAAGYVVRPRSPNGDWTVNPRAVPDDDYGPLAGVTGLKFDWGRQLASMGLWLRKPFWGRGYSSEKAPALMALAFERLDLQIVEMSHDPDNDKSRDAIQKWVERFGGRREGRFRNFDEGEDGPVDQVRYTVGNDEWEQHRPDTLQVRFYD